MRRTKCEGLPLEHGKSILAIVYNGALIFTFKILVIIIIIILIMIVFIQGAHVTKVFVLESLQIINRKKENS